MKENRHRKEKAHYLTYMCNLKKLNIQKQIQNNGFARGWGVGSGRCWSQGTKLQLHGANEPRDLPCSLMTVVDKPGNRLRE